MSIRQSAEGRRADEPASPDGGQEFGQSRENLAFWINCIGAAILVVEPKTLAVRDANRSASRFFARSIDMFSGCDINTLVGPEAGQTLASLHNEAVAGLAGEPFMVHAHIQEQDRQLLIQVTSVLVEGEGLLLFTITDAPPQIASAPSDWEKNFRTILNWLPFGFEIANNDDHIQFSNAQCKTLFGYEQHEIENVENWWLLAYPDPDYRAFAKWKWETEIAAARAENREMTPFDLDVTVKDGSRKTIQFRHRTIGSFNVNLYLDVTRDRDFARELKKLAETDPLTGTMNRRSFLDKAERLYQFDASSQTAILMLDIDHFKRINDHHGHATGDLVLKEFTQRCMRAIRSNDLLARFGGEEFAILLHELDPQLLPEIAERIRKEINGTPFSIANRDLEVTVSLGASLRFAWDKLEHTISRADNALYAAKNSGRNRVVIDG